MKLKTRVLIIVAASLLGLVVMGFLGIYSMRQSMMEERRAQITQLLDFVDSQLKYYHSLETSVKLTRAEAQARAIEAIAAQRYGDNYFFIRTLTDEYFVYHPVAARMGKADNGGILPDGRSAIRTYWDELAKSKDNKAFIELRTARPNSKDKTQLPKLNGALKFEPWGWMPGIGFFIDDIETRFWQQAKYLLIVGSSLLIVLSTLVFRMRSVILRQLGGEPQDAAEKMSKIASGDLNVVIELNKDDNTSLMASLKLMQMKLINITSAIQENASSLTGQVQSFNETTKAYSESKSEEELSVLLGLVKKIGKTVAILERSVARFKL